MSNKDELKQSLTIVDIEKILKYFNIDYKYNSQDDIQMETACHNAHGGSHKLYYYPESQTFHCFTECADSFDIYEFVMRVSTTRQHKLNFNEAYKTVADILGVNTIQSSQRVVRFGSSHDAIKDWEFIGKLAPRRTQKPTFEQLDENILNQFPNWYTKAWIDEDITPETHEKFGIRFNPDFNQTVLGHRDENGNLIGIRVRNWRDEKNKYMPLYYKGKGYNHPIGYALYGLYENKESIKALKKVVLVESEKSVLKSHSMFGEDNFVVGLSGSFMNAYQAELLMSLGVEEVTIALDKDYINQPDEQYYSKVRRIAKLFINKVKVYHITDTRGVLGHKDCFLDADKDEVVNIMEHNKFKIKSLEEIGTLENQTAD